MASIAERGDGHNALTDSDRAKFKTAADDEEKPAAKKAAAKK